MMDEEKMYFTAMALAIADGTIDEYLTQATPSDREKLSRIWDKYSKTPIEAVFRRPDFTKA